MATHSRRYERDATPIFCHRGCEPYSFRCFKALVICISVEAVSSSLVLGGAPRPTNGPRAEPDPTATNFWLVSMIPPLDQMKRNPGATDPALSRRKPTRYAGDCPPRPIHIYLRTRGLKRLRNLNSEALSYKLYR